MRKETEITEKIKRENRFKAFLALIVLIISLGILVGFYSVNRAQLNDEMFCRLLYGTGIILIFACWATWAIREWQRHDLYCEAKDMSWVQLDVYINQLVAVRDQLKADEIEAEEIEK